MDPGGEVAQLVDGRARVVERLVDEPAGHRRIALPCLAGDLQLEHERHEPLLGAVVEVAAEAAALGVAGLDEPRPRRAQGGEPRAQLRLEAGVLDRQRGGPGGGPEELGLLAQRGVVDDRRDHAPVVRDLGRDLALPVVRRRELHRPAGAVDVAPAVVEPVGDEQRGIREHPAEGGVDPGGARVADEAVDEPRDRRAAQQAAAREAEQERDRQQRERDEEGALRGGADAPCPGAPPG